MGLVQVILHGSSLRVAGQTQAMPDFGASYSDADVAAVANFVSGLFGNGTTKVTAADIDKARKALP